MATKPGSMVPHPMSSGGSVSSQRWCLPKQLSWLVLTFLSLAVIGLTGVDGARFGRRSSTYRSYSSYRSSYSSYRSSYSSYRSYIPTARYSRSYASYRGYYYYYYRQYFYYYNSGTYLNRNTGEGGTICENYEANDNGTFLGAFSCPNPFEPDDFTYCCGDNYAEYCCRLADQPGIIAGIVIGSLIGLVILILIIVWIVKTCKGSQRKVNPRRANESVAMTRTSGRPPGQRPGPHPGHARPGPGQGPPPYPIHPGVQPRPQGAPPGYGYPPPAGGNPGPPTYPQGQPPGYSAPPQGYSNPSAYSGDTTGPPPAYSY